MQKARVPERFLTSWSKSCSICIGLSTSVTNCGCMYACVIFSCSSMRTVLSDLGEIFCGLYETFSAGHLPAQCTAVAGMHEYCTQLG